LGETFFTLLEVVPLKGVTFIPLERIFIGKFKREKVERIKRRIGYEELTAAAKSELPVAIEKLVDAYPERFIDFFNRAAPLTTRFHQLELLPGIGKKLMLSIIEERKKGPFQSFEDLSNRIKSLPHPKKMIVKRILMELEGVDKYKVFVRPPSKRGEEESE